MMVTTLRSSFEKRRSKTSGHPISTRAAKRWTDDLEADSKIMSRPVPFGTKGKRAGMVPTPSPSVFKIKQDSLSRNVIFASENADTGMLSAEKLNTLG